MSQSLPLRGVFRPVTFTAVIAMFVPDFFFLPYFKLSVLCVCNSILFLSFVGLLVVTLVLLIILGFKMYIFNLS